MSIRKQLLIWLLSGLLLASLMTSAAIYLQVSDEANELFDFQLRQIVEVLPLPISQQTGATGRRENDFVLQAWSGSGALLYASHSSHLLPQSNKTGYTNLSADHHEWRIYRQLRAGVYIQAAQSMKARNKLVFSSAISAILPLLLLTPMAAFIINLAVKRALQPVHRVAQALQQRSAQALDVIPSTGIPPDILPMVEALNALLHRLQQALDKQRAFIADASHELRSPLTALKLQLQLAESAISIEERQQAFEKLHQRLDRATHLLQQLLTLARHEPGSNAITYSQVNLQQLAQEVIGEFIALAESKRISLGMTVDNEPALVSGQKDWLYILLRNLTDNALRYTPEGGAVDIQISQQNGDTLLKVIDNGPGIPVEEQQRVFDRFYRRAGETATGSGLGLAIVSGIAIQHNASVNLMSNPEGTGLIVEVSFKSD